MATKEKKVTVESTTEQLEYLQQETILAQTEAFKRENPDYFLCPQNGKMLVEYCQKHKLPISSENLATAKDALTDQRKLIYPGKDTLAKMTAQEVRQVAEVNGKARYDEGGNYIGSDFDPAWLADTEGRQLKANMRAGMSHPEDLNRKPTKKEFLFWDSDRTREWLVATGNWGRELPEYLR